MESIKIKHRELYEHLRELQLPCTGAATKNRLFLFVQQRYGSGAITAELEEIIRQKISQYCSHLTARWTGSGVHKIAAKFEKKFANWLENEIQFPQG
jgi:hypothetical protein